MRIVIAEDSVLLRDGLTRMLTDGGFEVVAAVPDAAQLLQAVAEHRPELAVIDVRMPPTHTDEGIKAALVIRRQFPDVALLVLSQYVEESYATDLLSEASSSVGYLLKDRVAHVRDFLDALRRVAAGGTALDPEVVAQLLVRRRDDPMDRLTPREQQVLKLMAEGRSNTGIMETLKVSPSAVEKYVTNIFLKLDLPPTNTDHRRVLAVLKYPALRPRTPQPRLIRSGRLLRLITYLTRLTSTCLTESRSRASHSTIGTPGPRLSAILMSSGWNRGAPSKQLTATMNGIPWCSK